MAEKAPELASDHVFARVLKNGHEKIYTGEYVDLVFATYKQGDTIQVHKDNAPVLEDRGFIEVA